MQNCELDLKHLDSAGTCAKLIMNARYAHGRFSAERVGEARRIGQPPSATPCFPLSYTIVIIIGLFICFSFVSRVIFFHI
jgi:hypothetical protein